MSKIVFISVHPIHYNDYLFSEIAHSGIDIDVYYTSNFLSNYPWKDKLNYKFNNKNCSYKFGIDWGLVKRVLSEKETVFIVAGWETLFKNVLFFLLILTGRKYILWTDTIKNHIKRNSLKSALRAFWINKIFNNAYRIFTTGEVGVSAMKQAYNGDHSKIVNFPFATDVNYFNATPDFSSYHFCKRIISSGRLLNSHKGYDLGIQALAELKKRGHSFKYYMAGTGPDKDSILDLIKECGLEDYVIMLGWQEISQVKELYGKTHILLHPSHFDPFPNAVLEAMASGLIVIASDKAGSAVERVTPNVSGYIFADNDLDGLVNALEKAFNLSNSEAQAMSVAAKETSDKWDIKYHMSIIKKLVGV